MKKFTIIIPIFNECESIFDLIDEINKEFKNNLPEILIVDDGSVDDFRNKVEQCKTKTSIYKHKKNLGKCRAMQTGVMKAKNNLVCIMDGDGQNPPYEVKNLINFWKTINNNKNKKILICGNRRNRQDTLFKKISSIFANKVRKSLLKDDCNDTACALKLFYRSEYLKIKYFKNMHRFLPALFKMNKCKVFNVLVDDRPRRTGISKYTFNNRFWVGIMDLIKVWILINKEKKNG